MFIEKQGGAPQINLQTAKKPEEEPQYELLHSHIKEAIAREESKVGGRNRKQQSRAPSSVVNKKKESASDVTDGAQEAAVSVDDITVSLQVSFIM